jgi:hypothetical protein
VEEGTTNLLSNPSFETYTGTSGVADNWLSASNSTVTPNYSVESIGYNSNRSQKIEITNSTGLGDAIVYRLHTLTIGSTYTLSAYVRGNVTGTCVGFVRIRPKLGGGAIINTFVTYFVPTNQWQRVSVTATIPEETSYCEITVGLRAMTAGDIGTLYIDNVQLEEKPFATSFTEGTRPDPRLKIPLNYKGDWVLSFWFRPDWEWGTVPVASAPEPTYNLASWGTPGRNGWLFRIDIFDMPDYINLETYAPTVDSFANPANFGLNNRNWAYFVIVSDISNKLFKVYINGQLATSQSNPDWDMPPDDYISIGTRRFKTLWGAANGLFSNILIARYDPAIWTDSYIRFLYETQKPFFV